MRRGGRLAGALVVAALVLAATACSTPDQGSSGDPSPVKSPKQRPTSSPASSTSASPGAVATSVPGTGPIEIVNLTMGPAPSKDVSSVWTTEPVTFATNTLGLVHVFGCCDLAAPTLTSPAITWELELTHDTGEKRHWVFRGVARQRVVGPITIAFTSIASRALWIVDQVAGVPLGDNRAEAIAQTAWQDSQANDTHGGIGLAPFADPVRGVAVGFALAGSGAATDIVPEEGYVETNEAETTASNILISTFWRQGEDRLVEATFVKEPDGSPSVQSWLFLAMELVPA